MSLQRQFNRHGITLEAAVERNREGQGLRRVKAARPWRSYRNNPLTVEERILRQSQLKGKYGIAPTIYQGRATLRRKPSIYMPHVGGKGFVPRPKKIRQQRIMSMGELFSRLASMGQLFKSKRLTKKVTNDG